MTTFVRLTSIAIGVALFVGTMAHADDQDVPGECSDGFCGTPKEEGGGGGGGGGGGSVLIANTDLGDTYEYADDQDEDGIEDAHNDNCIFAANADQLDSDSDGAGDACDPCPMIYDGVNPLADADNDGMGDACDDDADGDGVGNDADNCPLVSNASQVDTDKDGLGNPCDQDDDNDGFADLLDLCPLVATAENTVLGVNMADCDWDSDQDGITDAKDNCPFYSNRGQEDMDGDFMGDKCDGDADGDGHPNRVDNCPLTINPDQKDGDRDGKGDACDAVFCYVVDQDNPDNPNYCLNPSAPMLIASAGPNIYMETGDTIRLRIFANREMVKMRYSWSIQSAADLSEATPTHPVGEVEYSSPFEYHYQRGHVALFTPDQPGDYYLTLTLERLDTHEMASTGLKVHSHGDPIHGWCATAPIGSDGGPTWLLLFRRR